MTHVDYTWPSLVADLVRSRRFDEALAALYAENERAPHDRAVTRAIERVREEMAEDALALLGPPEAVPQVTNRTLFGSGELGADERYVLTHIDGKRTIDQLVRTSTLGRHRTSRILVWLVSRRLVEIRARQGSQKAPSDRTAPLATVIVADANMTQASLARTMLRVCLDRAVAFHAATHANEVLATAARDAPGLVVIDFRLPGHGDGIETLRALRRMGGLATTPALIVATRVEADYVRTRLPPQAELLVRPIARGPLESALKKLVPGALDSR